MDAELSQKIADHFAVVDPKIAQLWQEFGPIELTTAPDPFTDLCSAIIGQQLSTKVARVIENRFLELAGSTTLTPEQVIVLDPDAQRACGISWSKISYVRNVAEAALSGQIDFDHLAQMEDAEIITHLVKIKGVGQWTAEMFLMFTLGRPDVFSGGDLGLRQAIKNNYELAELPSAKEAAERAEVWTPYRTYASRVLWQSLDTAKKKPALE
jgi:DNA-3-methyladenine glycosylase II